MKLRKVMLLAAMLAMVLAAAAPAFAQAVIEDDDTAVQYVDCSQVQELVVNQGQYGDANAAADDESAAIATAANQLGITQQQVNACLGEIGTVAGGDVVVDDDDGTVVAHDGGTVAAADDATAAAAADDDATATAAAEDAATAAAEGELPETGGASLIALGAGALLVAGGLVARRIVR